MRIFKLALLVALLIGATGCACRTNQVGDNIGRAEPGSELQDVHFAFDSYVLDAAAKSILSRNAEWLKSNSGRKVQVEGHCDERGTNEYNMALGAKRARAAADYIKTLGVEGSRIGTVSYGEELPLDPRHTEEAWAKNRRAHFTLQ